MLAHIREFFYNLMEVVPKTTRVSPLVTVVQTPSAISASVAPVKADRGVVIPLASAGRPWLYRVEGNHGFPFGRHCDCNLSRMSPHLSDGQAQRRTDRQWPCERLQSVCLRFQVD